LTYSPRVTEVPQQLPGGLGNQGQVVRIGDTVRRPAGPHSEAVNNLLEHLRRSGFDAAPALLGKDPEGRDVYEWIDGDVPIPPFPAWALADEALIGTARLIRRLHDALSDFEAPPEASWSSERSDPRGGTLICHTDICPENVVFREGQAVAILDFDFASPGRPVWDLAMAARMWAVLRPGPDGDPPDATVLGRRLGCLAAGYGLAPGDHEEFVDAIVEAQRVGNAFVRGRVEAGEPGFVAMWDERGGAEWFDGVTAWMEGQRSLWLEALRT
jgi:aminoglycoside phosphotransferase (APT) family kinase protein